MFVLDFICVVLCNDLKQITDTFLFGDQMLWRPIVPAMSSPANNSTATNSPRPICSFFRTSNETEIKLQENYMGVEANFTRHRSLPRIS